MKKDFDCETVTLSVKNMLVVITEGPNQTLHSSLGKTSKDRVESYYVSLISHVHNLFKIQMSFGKCEKCVGLSFKGVFYGPCKKLL